MEEAFYLAPISISFPFPSTHLSRSVLRVFRGLPVLSSHGIDPPFPSLLRYARKAKETEPRAFSCLFLHPTPQQLTTMLSVFCQSEVVPNTYTGRILELNDLTGIMY